MPRVRARAEQEQERERAAFAERFLREVCPLPVASPVPVPVPVPELEPARGGRGLKLVLSWLMVV
ncbi:GL21119 [Drosophila persimilis]|uniref:GL21119 n=1 Tax=Drosophila persimilis TaxID=7234 RepID=B4GXF5_DROPE|nr:GL21119 [Drosophila persimilis]